MEFTIKPLAICFSVDFNHAPCGFLLKKLFSLLFAFALGVQNRADDHRELHHDDPEYNHNLKYSKLAHIQVNENYPYKLHIPAILPADFKQSRRDLA